MRLVLYIPFWAQKKRPENKNACCSRIRSSLLKRLNIDFKLSIGIVRIARCYRSIFKSSIRLKCFLFNVTIERSCTRQVAAVPVSATIGVV